MSSVVVWYFFFGIGTERMLSVLERAVADMSEIFVEVSLVNMEDALGTISLASYATTMRNIKFRRPAVDRAPRRLSYRVIHARATLAANVDQSIRNWNEKEEDGVNSEIRSHLTADYGNRVDNSSVLYVLKCPPTGGTFRPQSSSRS